MTVATRTVSAQAFKAECELLAECIASALGEVECDAVVWTLRDEAVTCKRCIAAKKAAS